MERKIYSSIIFILILQLNTFTQSLSDLIIYKAYKTGNMNDWKNQMDEFKAYTDEQKLTLINYYYGYIAYCIAIENKTEAKNYLDKAEKLLKELESKKYRLSMLYAYKSAFIGFNIGISPYKAPLIGKKSLEFVKKSISLDNNNYFAYIQLGNIYYYTPTIFGGSKSDAIKNYLKALDLLEKNSTGLKKNWNYLNLLVTIINAFYEIGQYENAKKYCIKTLMFEPEFDWVKNKICPEIFKK